MSFIRIIPIIWEKIMKHKLTLIALMALILLAMIPAQASQTITVSAPGATAAQDILVYYPNGTLQGQYNTTSIIVLDNTSSYLFTLKPQGNNIIDNPTDWLTNYAFPYVRTNIIAIILIFAVIGFALFWRR